MKKDAYYFPHYSNAFKDRKIRRVVKDLGLEGYAIYFILLEVLRDQPDFKYPLIDVDLLADDIGTSEVKLNGVIQKYDLFNIDEEGNFFSPKQIFYLEPYIAKSKRAREAAKKRWKEVKSIANADANAIQKDMQMHSKCSAYQNASIVEYSRVENSRVENSKYTIDFEHFWKHWNENIKNQSNKKKSFDGFKKLKNDLKKELFDSIIDYSNSNMNHQYLKRCETYINQRHWEQRDLFKPQVRELGDF